MKVEGLIISLFTNACMHTRTHSMLQYLEFAPLQLQNL